MTDTRIEAVRRFNRFYTRRIGVLNEGLWDSKFNLTESRLLWELAHRDRLTATELARELELDAGYLSRVLRSLKEQGLIKSVRAADDARHQHLSLTAAGKRAFAPINARSQTDVSALLATLGEAQQQQLLASMASIEQLLATPDTPAAPRPVLLRPHRAGDMGWVIARHGALYTGEFGWDITFEALVARIAADFLERFDAKREACWIAERDGANRSPASRSCECCSWSRPRAASGSAPGWSPNASASRARPATARSCSGPTPTCSPRAASTRSRATCS